MNVLITFTNVVRCPDGEYYQQVYGVERTGHEGFCVLGFRGEIRVPESEVAMRQEMDEYTGGDAFNVNEHYQKQNLQDSPARFGPEDTQTMEDVVKDNLVMDDPVEGVSGIIVDDIEGVLTDKSDEEE